MKSLFITTLENIKLPLIPRRGLQITEQLYIANDPNYLSSLLTESFKTLAGQLKTDEIQRSNAVVYAILDLEFPTDPYDKATDYIDNFLREVNSFLMALWLVKDNGVLCSEGYLETRTYVSEHSLGMYFWYATAERKEEIFSVEDLRKAREYLDNISKFFGRGKNELFINPALPNNLPRLTRAWYFVENTRLQYDVAIKVANYVTCFEALFSTDSSELSHKLSERLALFLGEFPSEQEQIYDKMKKAYSVRSKTVHGDQLGKQYKDLKEIAVNCDNLLREALLKISGSDKLIAVFNGKKEGLEKYFLDLLFHKTAQTDSKSLEA